MVCALHRLFQTEEDDLVMEGKPPPTGAQVHACEEQPPHDSPGSLLERLRRFSRSRLERLLKRPR